MSSQIKASKMSEEARPTSVYKDPRMAHYDAEFREVFEHSKTVSSARDKISNLSLTKALLEERERLNRNLVTMEGREYKLPQELIDLLLLEAVHKQEDGTVRFLGFTLTPCSVEEYIDCNFHDEGRK